MNFETAGTMHGAEAVGLECCESGFAAALPTSVYIGCVPEIVPFWCLEGIRIAATCLTLQVANAKWQSWKQLGDLAQMEAMRLYVRTLEEELVSQEGVRRL
jgi:hypothetical protein